MIGIVGLVIPVIHSRMIVATPMVTIIRMIIIPGRIPIPPPIPVDNY